MIYRIYMPTPTDKVMAKQQVHPGFKYISTKTKSGPKVDNKVNPIH